MHGCSVQNTMIWISMLLPCCETSVGVGRVVGTIIPQFETEALIAGRLRIIRELTEVFHD